MNYAQAVDAFTNSIRVGHVRKAIISGLGVSVRISELPSWSEYREARDRHYCGKTRKQLRRIFRPSLNRRYGREFIDAQVKLQHEFLDVVMNEDRI